MGSKKLNLFLQTEQKHGIDRPHTRPPSYGWENEQGKLIKPTRNNFFQNFFYRLNIFHSKKNWLGFISLVLDIGIGTVFNFIFSEIFLVGLYLLPDLFTAWYLWARMVRSGTTVILPIRH